MEIAGMEVPPIALGLGVISALVCGIVTKQVSVPVIWKIASVVLGFVVGTAYVTWQANKG